MRRSGREHDLIDYARLANYEDNPGETAAPEQQQLNGTSSAQEPEQPSTSTSSTSNRSTSMPNHHSRSTSNSTANAIENSERPKSSWNTIVYGILAVADGPLTYTEIMQDIKDRYPFFRAASQDKVLKSGLKNPLYFHEAFCKGDIVNGKQTWGLKPGEFVDKKTGVILTPQPRNPIVPSVTSSTVTSRPAVQAQVVDNPNPVDSTPKASPSNHSRSSNPRFGRDILNPPEIPDSQDPSGSFRKAGAGVSTEQTNNSERIAETQPPTGRAGMIADNSSPGLSQTAAPPSPRPPLSKLIKLKFTKNPMRLAEAEDQSIHQLIGPIDREASAKDSASALTSQLAQTLVQFIPSSIEGTEQEKAIKTPPAVPSPKGTSACGITCACAHGNCEWG